MINQRDDDAEYLAWIERKREEEKAKTRGADRVPYTHPLYTLYYAIRKHCITGGLPSIMGVYFMPPYYVEKYPDACGIYGYGCVMLNKDYYDRHGIDDDVINTMFHELIHAYCDLKEPAQKIHDTDGDFHRPEFKDVCEKYGGFARWTNKHDGYNDARVTEHCKELIRQTLAERAG